jgi:hypothetical protein
MSASRMTRHADGRALNTACPPRRSFVASDARRRGQACIDDHRSTATFGAALSTPAMLAGVDNAHRFSVIVAG